MGAVRGDGWARADGVGHLKGEGDGGGNGVEWKAFGGVLCKMEGCEYEARWCTQLEVVEG